MNSSRTIGAWWTIANATADTGYVVRELITYSIVYKALYLEIWPKWEDSWLELSGTVKTTRRINNVYTGRRGMAITGDESFGVGSDFTWNLMGAISIRLWDLNSFFFGYRHLNTTYQESRNGKTYTFDATLSGPLLGLVFHF